MDKAEIRAILSAYRPGEEMEDPRFEQAKAAAEADPELAQWWAEQQEFDRVISSKLMSTEVPRDLKTRILAHDARTLAPSESHTAVRSGWSRGLLLAAASIVALAVMFSSWRGAFQPAVSLADYRDEMVSFVRLDPPLEVESAQLSRLTAFLKEKGVPSQINFPDKLQRLDPAGCRRLRFRGHDVSLICFKRGDGELVHLFAIDRKALARATGSRAEPELVSEENFAAASWIEGDYVYLLATKGSPEALQRYVGTS